MSNKDKLLDLIENGFDKDEMIQGLINWLGNYEVGEFLSKYLGIDEEE